MILEIFKDNARILINQKGAALVELALSLMLLLTIVFGIFEFGRAMFITNTLYNAARDGARRAVVSAVPLNIEGLKSQIKEKTPLSADELATLDISITPGSPTAGTAVTVTTLLPFAPVTPLVSCFFPDDFKLKGEASMRYE